MNKSVTGIGITMLGMTTLLLATVGRSLTAAEGDQQPGLIKNEMQNKPVQLSDGDLLCPSSTEHAGWRVHFERPLIMAR